MMDFMALTHVVHNTSLIQYISCVYDYNNANCYI